MRLPLHRRARVALGRPIVRAVVASPWFCRFAAHKRAGAVDGRALDPQLAALLWLDDLDRHSDVAGLSPARARLQVAEAVAVTQAPFVGDVAVQQLAFAGKLAAIPARLYRPARLEGNSPAVLYLHGGGFVTGDLDTHDPLCRLLASCAELRVISLDYRRAPEHRFPAAADDALAAFRELAARAHELGIERARIAVAGDSAGGQLAAVTALRARGDALSPALQVLVYPPLDATCAMRSHRTFAEGFVVSRASSAWLYRSYLGNDPATRRRPEASPIFARDLSGLAPALVYTCGFDPFRDEGMAYAERLAAAGVPVRHHCFDDMVHGFFQLTAASRAARVATRRVARELGVALRKGVR